VADLSLRATREELIARLSEGATQRLVAIAVALDEAAPLWRPRPFVADPPWTALYPEVVAWCEALTADEVVRIERAERLPEDAPRLMRAWEARLAALTTLTVSTGGAGVGAGVGVGVGERRVPARKSDQVAAFMGCIERAGIATGVGAVLDWCGGKGHLGRALGAHLRVPVTVLERQSRYAFEACELAERAGVSLRFEAADALAAPAGLMGPGVLAVGLHACGELGSRLVEHALREGVHTVALAPCCLHKVRGLRERGYEPLSQLGRAHDPRLDHESLRLATADEVVARPSLQAARRRENAWRMAFDTLARTAGRATYTPLGTMTEALRHRDFASFATEVATTHKIALPAHWDAGAAEAAGWQRSERARAFGLVRGLFKRTIELWCALDRSAQLEEAGFSVELVVFAPRATTPRNLLLLAQSRGSGLLV